MSQGVNVLHTGRTYTTGGRERGLSRSSDGCLDIRFSALGSARIGANPEQLLAACWSASFESAISIVAAKKNIAVPASMAIDAEVDLNVSQGGYFLTTRLNVSLPGVDLFTARALIDEAQDICPYSKATRGNIEVIIQLV